MFRQPQMIMWQPVTKLQQQLLSNQIHTDEVMKCLPFKAGTSFEIGGQFDESAKISETEQSTCLEGNKIRISVFTAGVNLLCWLCNRADVSLSVYQFL